MSQVTLGPPRVLDGPAPIPPRYNLLTVATIYDDLDEHWLAGAQIYGYPSLDDGGAHNPCVSGTYREKAEGGTISSPEFGAFTAYVAETCTARGIGNNEDFMNRAVTAFQGLEAALVENEFATGEAMPANPSLSDVSLASYQALGTLKTTEALARLENEIGRTGKMGVIGTDPATAVAWAGNCLVEREGATLRSIATGTPIVVGYGYIDVRPDGVAAPPATSGYAWATGPIQIRRTGIEVVPGTLAEALDRQINMVTYRAERHYLVDWDTELLTSVLVDRT